MIAMEIKEGMYVRNNMGSIYKVDNLLKWQEAISDHNIIGADYDIRKLVQEGDLIELTSEYCKDEIYRVTFIKDGVICLDCFGDGYITIDDIKRILTKEQFAAMSYEVK